MAHEQEGITQVQLDELKTILDENNKEPIVIDVREHEEYVKGHIPGIPLIPMSEIIDMLEDFDQSKSYLFVCRSGRRSQEVAKFFKNNGMIQVQNFSGGMLAWDRETRTDEENIITSIKELYEGVEDNEFR